MGLRSDEVFDTPVAISKDSEAVENHDDAEEGQGSVRAPGLEPAPEG